MSLEASASICSDVGRPEGGLASGRSDLRGDASEDLLAPRTEDNRRASLRQQPRGRPLDAAARSGDRYVDLVDEGFDAVRLGPITESGLVARELASHDQVACAAPSYLAAHGAPETPDALAEHGCLGSPTGRACLRRVALHQRRGGPSREGPQRFRVNDGRVLVAAAIAGHGIILQPAAVVEDALAAGALVPVLVGYRPPSRPISLMYLARRPQPPKLRVFVDHVVAALMRSA